MGAKHLVIGHGEVGTAVADLLEADWFDVEEDSGQIEDSYDMVHICIPYDTKDAASFKNTVKQAQSQFRPSLTIIHSTVPIGTSDELGCVHSPIRGVHPNLLEGLKTFVKFFGGRRAAEAAQPFQSKGVECRVVDSARNTEAMKLWETTQYGSFILLMQEIHEFCDNHDLDFNTVYTQANETYNKGYRKLGMAHVQRPILKFMGYGVGGHCVQRNSALLNSPTAYHIRKWI